MNARRLVLLVLLGVLVGLTIFWVPGRFAHSSDHDGLAPRPGDPRPYADSGTSPGLFPARDPAALT